MTRFTIVMLASALSLAAQTSSLQGTITDSLGAVAPGAVITAVNQDTSAERKTLSNARGEYSLLQVSPGPYVITAEKPGFRQSKAQVTLEVDTPQTLDLKLEVGQVTETVNVMASATVVNTENAATGNPFNETQIKEIPLQTRLVTSLMSVEPGVAASGQVAGAKPDQNNVMLDGVSVNSIFGGNGFNATIPIPLDSVQEFRTTVAGVGADQGYSSGGQISIVTKGGSNTFHGSLYEYNRNTFTAANSWSNNRAGTPRPGLIRNQYGASMGGPIRKNRLFFFYNFEGQKDRSSSSKTDQVPSPTLAQGIVEVQLKTTNQIVQLTPQMVKAIDPLGIGENPYIFNQIKQYPSGNFAAGGSDKGLNFYALTFNAPSKQDFHTQVARMDYNLDTAGKHTLMVRATLNGSGQDGTLSQFPGQQATSRSLDNTRNASGRYTWVISPTLVNTLNYGYNRPSSASTGVTTAPVPSFGFTAFVPTPRASRNLSPSHNITDDLTWTKGRHTIQFGVNMIFTENDVLSYNNFPSYSFSNSTLAGLGNDITNDVLTYIQNNLVPGAQLASTTNVINSFGAVFGIINSYGATFHYLVNGTPIPFGTPVSNAFMNQEGESYAQDSFKIKRNFTLTYGLRYSLMGVPYEKNGQELIPQTPLSEYFAQRVFAQANGISNAAMPDASVTYQIGGPVNGKPGYYPLDKGLFSPRVALAYSPDSGSLLEKALGKGSVLRAGGNLIFDHYGAALGQKFAQSGSPGLATTVAQPVNTDFTTSARYDGATLPALAVPVGGQFPYTPPTITGGFTTFEGIQTDLKAPYEYTINAAYARPLPKKLTIEVGYIGRLGHRGLLQQDFGQPLTNFKDPVSGQTLTQASAALAGVYNSMLVSGMTAAQITTAVKANPNLVPVEPFFENMFPGIKNYQLAGASSSANFFYDWYHGFGGSFLDTLNDMDRIRQPLAGGGCFSRFGCNTFYPLQNSGLETFTNTGTSSYNAATVVLRRAVQRGWGFDFNYTFGHALDNGSASETSGGAALQDAFNPRAYKGNSDFDAKHTVTFDYVIQVPVGKNKALWGSMPKAVDYALGGWQISGLTSFHTGTPMTVSTGNGVYNTNYEYSSFGVLAPGASLPKNGLTVDQNGYNSIFTNTNAVNSFVAANPGTVGSRGILRGVSSFNTDLAVSKYFKMPKEGHRFQIRAEAFNVFNRVNYGNPSLSIASPTTFGEITSAAAARVMQFAGRYEF